MLAYAADTRPAGRSGSPRWLVLILAGHAALIAAVMTARMDLVPVIPPDPTDIFDVTPIKPPPPEPKPPEPNPSPKQPSFIEHPVRILDLPVKDPPMPLDKGQAVLPWNPPVIGDDKPAIPGPPVKHPVRTAAIFATPDSALRPPYPAAKLRMEEEATLRLRLSIDERGRVISVEPVGSVDPAFFEAARRHIIRSWRYKPATADGVAVPTTTVVTLSFKLENA